MKKFVWTVWFFITLGIPSLWEHRHGDFVLVTRASILACKIVANTHIKEKSNAT